jgi:tol-pal system protein YbgF
MRWRYSLPVLVFAIAAQANPASAGPSKEYLQLMAEVRMLQEQNAQMQQLFGTLQDALKAVTTKLDEQAAASRKAMADQTLVITNIGDTVRVLREKADDTNVRITQVSQEIDTLRQAIATAQTAAAAAQQPQPQPTSPAPVGEPGAPPAGAAPPAPGVPPTVSPNRMYDASMDDFTAGRYDLAVKGFETFIQTFPRMTQAAANAQFNIGAAYYNQSKWPEARDAFQKVTQTYPNEAEANAQAYFKLGQTYERLNQRDAAKKAYETVVQKYPTSFQKNLADQALARLGGR